VQTQLDPVFQNTRAGKLAKDILRKCVHCGFCTATCPTYQLLGDELDSPRGRIYQIKELFEGKKPNASIVTHLDRCLICRSCETSCPSGVQYAGLLKVGRELIVSARPLHIRAWRSGLRNFLPTPYFAFGLATARRIRPWLPSFLRVLLPEALPAGSWPKTSAHARTVLLHTGCVQPAMLPNLNAATARVLDTAGIGTRVVSSAGCCGAIKEHLDDHDGTLARIRRNIDAWWPSIESGEVEAIISNASGCGLMLKEYAQLMVDDPDYAQKASKISAMTLDLSEYLQAPDCIAQLKKRLQPGEQRRLMFHPPCTLQHGQGIKGVVESLLGELGFEVQLPARESALCCGSAGTYSILQPKLAGELRRRKLEHLQASKADYIVSANIGCIQHLSSEATLPVRHWVEVVDAALGCLTGSHQ